MPHATPPVQERGVNEDDASRDLSSQLPCHLIAIDNHNLNPRTPRISQTPTSDELSDDSSISMDGHRLVQSEKERILHRLMLRFHEMYATAFTVQNGNEGSRSGETSQWASSPIRSTTTTNSNKTSDKRGCESDGERNHDKDRPNKRRKGNDNNKNNGNKNARADKRLACPYFKRDPQKYQGLRTCIGPGWDSVHRLEQHLYRRHAAPPYCQRCYGTFENETEMTAHLRAAEACPMISKYDAIIEGFDRDIEKRLKSRSSMFQADSEEEKWKTVYLILFPDTSLNELPSPYYGPEDAIVANPQSSSPSDLVQFKAYMNRELPRSVRQSLEAAIEEIIGPIEETLKNDLEAIIRNCHEALSKSYMQVASASTKSAKTSRDSNQAHAISRTPTQPEASVDALDTLAPYVVPPDSSFECWPDTIPDSNRNLAAISDSAYYSDFYDPTLPNVGSSWWASNSQSSFPVQMASLREPEYTGLMEEVEHQQHATDVAAPYKGKGKGKRTDSAMVQDKRVS